MLRIPDLCNNRQALLPIPVRLNGRIVGVVVGLEYRRTLQERHVLQRPARSIAVDVAVLDEAERHGATIGVWTMPDGWDACMGLAEFRRLAFPVDHGFGRQLAVPLSRFPRRIPAVQLPLELALFDG